MDILLDDCSHLPLLYLRDPPPGEEDHDADPGQVLEGVNGSAAGVARGA